MSIRDITQEDVDQVGVTLLQRAEDDRTVYLRDGMAAARREAEALRQEHTRLRDRLGAEHPKVRALEATANGSEAIARWAEETVGRTERRPEVRGDEWVVTGRVAAPREVAEAGLTVELADRDGRVVEQLGKVTPDARGEFVVSARGEEFRDLLTTHPDLFLRVTDAEGKTFVAAGTPLRPEPGRLDHLEVTIEAEEPGRGPSAAPGRRRGRRPPG